jgi:membrane protease YdiL (CAAX protease family)
MDLYLTTRTPPLIQRGGLLMHPLYWALGAAVALAVMRAAGLFGPRTWAPLLPLSFVLMAALPWLLLPREGRRQIGVQRSRSAVWYVVALGAGGMAAWACGAIFSAVFGTGPEHAYQTIATYYQRQLDARGFSLVQLHLAFTLPALVFSPIGEELFFRGLLQRALQDKLPLALATLTEAGLFAAVHLLHHGLAPGMGGWVPSPLSAMLWVALMFVVALMLAQLRRASGSLYPAMAAHAAFNAGMNVFIFAWLWS